MSVPVPPLSAFLRPELPVAAVAAERDGAYRERARLIAFLAASYPSVIMLDADSGAPGWPVVFVDTPAGQLSWHLAGRDLDLFPHVPKVPRQEQSLWDGHTTREKYERLAGLIMHLLDDRDRSTG